MLPTMCRLVAKSISPSAAAEGLMLEQCQCVEIDNDSGDG
jgi:hypothetical protein